MLDFDNPAYGEIGARPGKPYAEKRIAAILHTVRASLAEPSARTRRDGGTASEEDRFAA
jgi:hypothetical protein